MTEGFVLLASIAAITLAAGFIHSAIGFGFGIVAIALMPMIMDAKVAHVLVSVSSVPMLVATAWAYRDGFERRSLAGATAGAIIFLPLGLFLFEVASLDWLVRATGVAILAMVIVSIRNRSYNAMPGNAPEDELPKQVSLTSCFAAGGIGGFLAGAVSIAGPPVAALALKQGWPQTRFKAFVTQCLLVIAVYKTAWLVGGNYVDGDVLQQTAVATPAAVLGILLGKKSSGKISAIKFERLVAVVLVAVGGWMIFG